MRYGNSLPCVSRLCSVIVLTLCLISLLLVNHAQAQDADSGVQLYFVTSHGCAPCRQVEPHIEALQREGYSVSTLQFDEHQRRVTNWGVDRTPTVVMFNGDKMVGRNAGLIDAVTLKQWFTTQGINSGPAFKTKNNQPPAGTKVVLGGRRNPVVSAVEPRGNPGEFSSATMHRGTDNPKNLAEGIAYAATVRLKVEDPQGISYATGTVIHSFQGESLVVTCGHVFRDAKGKGEITAEYGFDGKKKSAPGELIFYDADARDIGLVAIRTSDNIVPVGIADPETKVDKGLDIFSIGCDHGEDPTIRRSQIKNRAAYDGAIKYDIFGRPVNGRSGGGLFNGKGELIGVCNAAAVEVDEGIYTALDTIHWQLAKVNLDHLFDPRTKLAATPVGFQRSNGVSNQPNHSGASRLARINSGPERTPVSWSGGGQSESDNDQEVIILVRSKSNPSQTESITISDPTPKLLDYLGSIGQGETRHVGVARLRTESESWRR